MAKETVARATIVLYDGAEQPVADEVDVLLEVRNNFGVNQTNWVKGPVIQLNLQFFDLLKFHETSDQQSSSGEQCQGQRDLTSNQ